jgi:hypothetical protein
MALKYLPKRSRSKELQLLELYFRAIPLFDDEPRPYVAGRLAHVCGMPGGRCIPRTPADDDAEKSAGRRLQQRRSLEAARQRGYAISPGRRGRLRSTDCCGRRLASAVPTGVGETVWRVLGRLLR